MEFEKAFFFDPDRDRLGVTIRLIGKIGKG